jgi:hypothetical protein
VHSVKQRLDVRDRNPLLGIWSCGHHVDPTQGACAHALWGCLRILPIQGGQGIQILRDEIHGHFIFPTMIVWKECNGMIKLMCVTSGSVIVTLVSQSDLQAENVIY